MSATSVQQKVPSQSLVPDRDIISNKSWKSFTDEEKSLCKKHDKMLQDGACRRPASEMLQDIETLGGGLFISGAMCPSVKATIGFHLAADIVNLYQVKEGDLNDKVSATFNSIPEGKINKIQESVNSKVASLDSEQVDKKALEVLVQSGKIKKDELNDLEALTKYKTSHEKEWEAAVNIGKDLLTKDITYSEVGEYIKSAKKEDIYKDLPPKTLYAQGKNNDISILGPQGSGKSTVVSKLGIKELDYSRAVSVDDFRSIAICGAVAPVEDPKHRLMATQNSAFFSKQLAMTNLLELDKNKQPRPNIMVDAVTPDPAIAKILKNPRSYVIAYSPANVSEIVERVNNRAKEGGVYLNMEGVLNAHQNPYGTCYNVPVGKTTMIDTDVGSGGEPRVIGKITKSVNGEMSLEVVDVKSVSEFFDKKNIISKSTQQLGLKEGFLKTQELGESKTTTDESLNRKTDALTGLLSFKTKVNNVEIEPFKEIRLMNAEGEVPYATIQKSSEGKLSVKHNQDELTKYILNPEHGAINKGIISNIFKNANNSQALRGIKKLEDLGKEVKKVMHELTTAFQRKTNETERTKRMQEIRDAIKPISHIR